MLQGSISFSGRKHRIDRGESPPTAFAGVPAPCRLLCSSPPPPGENIYEGDDCGPERLHDFPKVTQQSRDSHRFHSRMRAFPQCLAPSP